MAPADQLAGRTEASRAARSYTCPHYDPVPGGKRCRHYLDNGACSLPDELMCTEWLKANGHEVPPVPARGKDSSSELDLFGNPVQAAPPPAREGTKPPLRRESTDVSEAPPLQALSDEDIASFKALGVEVCIESEACGSIWLVPAYTGADRKEISVEHAATLALICSVFPGARVVSFERSPDGTAAPTGGAGAQAQKPAR